MADDYYKILGIDKTASAAEIKKAYRKLALQYHPDKTKGDKSLEEKFKKISEAYAVLSNAEKKQQYDTYGSSDFQQRFSQEDIFRNFNMGDIFKEFGFGSGGFSASFGQNPHIRGGFSNMGGGFSSHRRPAPTPGKNIEYELPLTLEELFQGCRKTITIQQQGVAKAVEVSIPKGLTAGKKIRLAGKGSPGSNGGPPGHLYITSQPVMPPGVSIKGKDIFISKEVRLSQALLGDKIDIVTPEGKAMTLNLPAGTNNKAKMRLSGQGIPDMKGNGFGDLFVVIHFSMPKQLTREQKNLIEQLQATGL